MAYKVDFKEVSTTGLESSPVAESLAGLRAHEARYFWNKFKHEFVTTPATEDPETLGWIESVLKERQLSFPYKPLEVTNFVVEGTRFAYVFYENGLAVNVMYSIADGGKRAVGFKLAEGMTIPEEFAAKFKFARQKSALAGEIRGSYFVIKGCY
ncbi:phage tail protein [Vagococcus sp. BWB3-3]|uniref:Phage tail protein n=1 Tax=Vagococcus allomyrinae TaxID=2794353 RepID=A0A940P214_9ENTE|nr:phage tail protein [Vagococcus allomyrinae]MBP1039605.1 phage tail protein [Vagococcus allomyrinae]